MIILAAMINKSAQQLDVPHYTAVYIVKSDMYFSIQLSLTASFISYILLR